MKHTIRLLQAILYCSCMLLAVFVAQIISVLACCPSSEKSQLQISSQLGIAQAYRNVTNNRFLRIAIESTILQPAIAQEPETNTTVGNFWQAAQQLTRTRRSTHIGPQNPKLLWQFKRPGFRPGAAILDSHGNVLVTGTPEHGKAEPCVLILDRSGKIIWQWSGADAANSPTLRPDGGFRFIGINKLNSSTGGYREPEHMYSFSPSRSLEWSCPVPEYIGQVSGNKSDDEIWGGLVTAGDDTTYAGTKYHKLLAFRAPGVIAWTAGIDNPASTTSVIGMDGSVYTCCYNYFHQGESKVWAFDPDGKERWSVVTAGRTQFSEIALADNGTLYICLVSDWVENEDGTTRQFGAGLTAVSQTGELLWILDNGQEFTVAPALASDGTVMACSQGSAFSFLIAVTPQGKVKWQNPLVAGDFTSPVLDTNDVVYLCQNLPHSKPEMGTCIVDAINPDSTLKWSFELPAMVLRQPLIAGNGVLIVVGQDSVIYAIGD